jgi:hypothetical protein
MVRRLPDAIVRVALAVAALAPARCRGGASRHDRSANGAARRPSQSKPPFAVATCRWKCQNVEGGTGVRDVGARSVDRQGSPTSGCWFASLSPMSRESDDAAAIVSRRQNVLVEFAEWRRRRRTAAWLVKIAIATAASRLYAGAGIYGL